MSGATEIDRRRAAKMTRLTTVFLGLIYVPAAWLAGQQYPLLSDSTKALYQNEFAKSESLATHFLRAHPDQPDGLVVLARAQMAQGKLGAAYQNLTRALQTNPKHIDALYYLSHLSLALSQGEYEKLVQTAPNSVRTRLFSSSSRRRS